MNSYYNTDKLENSENCWDPLRAFNATTQLVTVNVNAKKLKDWAISSRASWRQVEGSSTNAYGLNESMKQHEYTGRKARYSQGLWETLRSYVLNALAITIRPFSEKLDNLSEHSVKEVINKVLKNDAKKAFDIAARAQFNLTPLWVAPTGGTSTTAVTLTTNGATATINNVAMGKDHIKAISDLMKERNIPAYQGDDYMCIGHPSTFRSFKNDLETIHQYTDQGFGMIMNGEIGRYEGCRFIEQTNIAKETWSNGKSNWAYFFGEDTVAEAIACPEEMRGKIPTDYGRSKGIAWYYLGGFGLVHADATQARIVKWSSLS